MSARSLIALVLAASVLPAPGCGGSDGDQPELVPVSGTVTLDGAPLKGAVVTFIPAGTTKGVGGTGVTDESGRYEAKWRGGQSGLPVGEYRVTCAKMVMPDGSDVPADTDDATLMGSGAKQLLPPRYSDSERTTLAATVAAGGGTFDFDLKSGG